MENLCAHRLNPLRHEGGRRAQTHARAQSLQTQQIRARDTAVQNIAANHDLKASEILGRLAPLIQRSAQSQSVEQSLCGVLMAAIARIQNRAIHFASDQLCRAA